MPAAVDDRYVRYLVARLAAHRNVWWSLANEYDFMKELTFSECTGNKWLLVLSANATPRQAVLAGHECGLRTRPVVPPALAAPSALSLLPKSTPRRRLILIAGRATRMLPRQRTRRRNWGILRRVLVAPTCLPASAACVVTTPISSLAWRPGSSGAWPRPSEPP